MYERFRDELMAKLGSMDTDTLRIVMSAIDQVASRYEIKRADTELIPYSDGLLDVVKAYLVSRSIDGLSKTTLGLYKRTLATFLRTIGKGLTQVTANDLRVWLYGYEERHAVSKRTLELYREILGGFFRWANAEGWLPSNPCATLKPIKFVKKPRHAMEPMELEYIRGACQTDRELALVELLYSTGARVSEVSALRIQDVDWEHKEVTLFGKGAKYRTSYLNAKAIVALRKYLDGRGFDSDALIAASKVPHGAMTKSGLERMIRSITDRVKDKLGVPVTPHVFRHTTATTALQRGMPVQDVQRMLGHVNINTTMVYAEISQSEVKDMHGKCVV